MQKKNSTVYYCLLPCMFVDILTTQYILHTSLKFHQEGLLAINLSPRAKGQLTSKCLFDVFNSSKKNQTKTIRLEVPYNVYHVGCTDTTQLICQVTSLVNIVHQLPGKSARWCRCVQHDRHCKVPQIELFSFGFLGRIEDTKETF